MIVKIMIMIVAIVANYISVYCDSYHYHTIYIYLWILSHTYLFIYVLFTYLFILNIDFHFMNRNYSCYVRCIFSNLKKSAEISKVQAMEQIRQHSWLRSVEFSESEIKKWSSTNVL